MPNRIPASVALLALFVAVSICSAQRPVEVTNNQPFPIAMPIKLLAYEGATVMVKVDTNAKQTIALTPAKPAVEGGGSAVKVSIEPADSGVRLKSGERD